jgi:two-component system invasion response regulator UvrY
MALGLIKRKITVLIVDDHAVVRSGYKRLLENKPDLCVIAEAENGKTGCNLFEKHKPDVAIIDIRMPGIDGFETIRRIKAKNPDAHILIFSMYNSEILVQRALNAGATGYLTKQSGFDQMIEAVRQVSQGKLYVDKDIVFDTTFSINSENILDTLTKREFQIFKLLAEGNSTKKIADTLVISPKTVGVHHVNIMRKLKLHNNSQLIHLGIHSNLIDY